MIRVTLAPGVPLCLSPQRVIYVRPHQGPPYMNPPPPGWNLVSDQLQVEHRSQITYKGVHDTCPDTFSVCESPEGIATLMKDATKIVHFNQVVH